MNNTDRTLKRNSLACLIALAIVTMPSAAVAQRKIGTISVQSSHEVISPATQGSPSIKQWPAPHGVPASLAAEHSTIFPLDSSALPVSAPLTVSTAARLQARATNTPPDACAIAPAADIAAAFGAPYTQQPGSPQTDGTVSRCDWKGPPVSILMVRTEAIDKASFEASMKGVPGGVKTVSGLGESAYYQASQHQFFAYKGKTKVSINFAFIAQRGGAYNMDDAKIEAAENALLAKIVSRL